MKELACFAFLTETAQPMFAYETENFGQFLTSIHVGLLATYLL